MPPTPGTASGVGSAPECSELRHPDTDGQQNGGWDSVGDEEQGDPPRILEERFENHRSEGQERRPPLAQYVAQRYVSAHRRETGTARRPSRRSGRALRQMPKPTLPGTAARRAVLGPTSCSINSACTGECLRTLRTRPDDGDTATESPRRRSR